jgi:hypothetical protein
VVEPVCATEDVLLLGDVLGVCIGIIYCDLSEGDLWLVDLDDIGWSISWL